MTAQFPDEFIFNDTVYSVAGIHGDPPFDPDWYAMNPVSPVTACWRGFICTFAIHDNELILSRLSIHLGKIEGSGKFIPLVGPQINGRDPALAIGPLPEFNNIYEGVDLPLPFTGGLLIARDFIKELYVHMGFHPAWKYREVWELLFDDGILTDSQDVSIKLAELREKLMREPLEPQKDADLQKWIQGTFRLDY